MKKIEIGKWYSINELYGDDFDTNIIYNNILTIFDFTRSKLVSILRAGTLKFFIVKDYGNGEYGFFIKNENNFKYQRKPIKIYQRRLRSTLQIKNRRLNIELIKGIFK